MKTQERLISDLLVSISGVFLFISLAYWVDLNGYSDYGPLFLVAGLLILLWTDKFINPPSYVSMLSRKTLQTLSHILIFIGLEVYFHQYIEQYCFVFLVGGIIFLNYSQNIAKLLVGKR